MLIQRHCKGKPIRRTDGTENSQYLTMSNVAAAAEDERPARVRVNAAEQAVSACSGAVLTSLFITPLDVVKVKMQHN